MRHAGREQVYECGDLHARVCVEILKRLVNVVAYDLTVGVIGIEMRHDAASGTKAKSEIYGVFQVTLGVR